MTIYWTSPTTYNSVKSQVEKVVKSELDDGNENLLNESYNSVKSQVEKVVKSELDDGNDHLLHQSYELIENKRRALPQNLHHLLENSREEINRNHLLAKIRLRERRIKWIEKFKSEMADYFFKIEEWPNYAIEILLSKNFGYSERAGLACFMFGNGLTGHEKALRIFQIYNNAWTHDKN